MAEPVAQKSSNAPALSEDDVCDWLLANPGFFGRNPQVLEAADLHHASGRAASLIERQVDWLRIKNTRLEGRLSQLVDTARDNEQRARKVVRLAHTLLRAPTLANMVANLRLVLREEFAIDEVFLGVLAPKLLRKDIDGLTRIDAKGTVARAFDNALRTRMIETGPMDAERANLLFPRARETLQSAAVVPLDKQDAIGLLVLAAADPKRFAADQGKLFLEMTAELLGAALRARLG